MKNLTISELERPAFTGICCGGPLGAHYGNSMTWAAIGAILGMAFFIAMYLRDKKKKSQSNN